MSNILLNRLNYMYMYIYHIKMTARIAPRLKGLKFKVFEAYIVITTNIIIIFYCVIISGLVWLTHNAKKMLQGSRFQFSLSIACPDLPVTFFCFKYSVN